MEAAPDVIADAPEGHCVQGANGNVEELLLSGPTVLVEEQP